MDRRAYLRGGMAIALPLVAGCFGGPGDGGDSPATGNGVTDTPGRTPTVVETTRVTMTDRQFQPRNIHVDLGVPVTWENEDAFEHTVSAAADAAPLDRGVAAGGSVTYAFEESRVYGVFCRYHGSPDLSGMAMKVGVGEATIENPVGGDGDGYDY